MENPRMTTVDEAPTPAPSDPIDQPPSIEGRRVVFYCLAIISAVAAVIHFAVSGEHFEEYWLFGVFMLVVAWLQLLWAIVAVAKPSRLLLWSGAILNAGVVAIYIVTRTVGDVIGPTPHDVEPFGFGDGFCTVLEAILVVGCAWLLTARMERRVERRRLIVALATTGTVAAVLLSVSLVDGGSEMVMSMSDSDSSSSTSMPGMDMSAPAPAAKTSVDLATVSPAGSITMPNPSMTMAPGMAMASSTPCTASPSSAQEKAAVNLVNTSWQGASKYQSLAVAKAAGYLPITPTGKRVVHYINRSYYLDTVRGGTVLNTDQPQSLVYANTPKGAVLAAAMYITSPRGGATPQPGGCLTQWHVHTNLCLDRLGVVGTDQSGSCPAGSRNRVTPAMMHVWFVPIPGGPTAVDATDAQVVHAAEQVPAPVNAPA
jgi:hypothetical protein